MRVTRHPSTPIRLAIAISSALVLVGALATPAQASPTPVVAAASSSSGETHKTVTKKVAIPFKTVTKPTSTLKKGVHKTSVRGVAGVRTKVVKYGVRDGLRVSTKVISSTITKKPVTKVVLIGTKVAAAAHCDPNYSGQCVPIASDVDCGGGSGNGPGYVYGPVEVIGSDIYDLDRDGDGVGCDN